MRVLREDTYIGAKAPIVGVNTLLPEELFKVHGLQMKLRALATMVSDAAVPFEPVGGKLVELLQTIVRALRHCLRRCARRQLHTTSTCAPRVSSTRRAYTLFVVTCTLLLLARQLWVESFGWRADLVVRAGHPLQVQTDIGGEGRSPPAGADRRLTGLPDDAPQQAGCLQVAPPQGPLASIPINPPPGSLPRSPPPPLAARHRSPAERAPLRSGQCK